MKVKISQRLGVIDAGGPGSGNRGHKGRKGLRGGSSSGSGVSSNMENARRIAKGLYDAAVKDEPAITAHVSSAVEAVGGRLEGLDFRLKSESSIRSKLFRDMEEAGGKKSMEQVASEMTDLVRYTAILEEKGFSDACLGIQNELKQRGWEQYDSKWRNYFVEGNVYMGYNTVVVDSKSGQRYELQFHTHESFRRKERGHQIYEEFRELKEGDPRRGELMDEQRKLWDGFTIPEGTETLPGIVMGGK